MSATGVTSRDERKSHSAAAVDRTRRTGNHGDDAIVNPLKAQHPSRHQSSATTSTSGAMLEHVVAFLTIHNPPN
jgi:hypothetical protein